ncbi:hypothetical protein [Desulfonema magnum]|uniref:hypothetical protein n=1 Tax=Desulfonema magnum TaxID=45655 RepID=UPI001A9A9D8B|nr:hypothetical protein [Desulfonema magnum]
MPSLREFALRKSIFRTPAKLRAYPECKNYIFAIAKKQLRKSDCEKAIFALRRVAGVSGVQKLYFCDCEKAIAKKQFSNSGELRAYPECKNYIFAIAKKRLRKSNFRTPESCGRIRSAKIIFLRLRKSNCEKAIFALRRVAGVSGVQKLYFCDCEKAFFALRRNSGRIRSAKILFLHLRKSIFRTPEKFRPDPECKNYIFAIAKKHFSHSGEIPAGSGVQKFYFCNCEKAFFALRRNSGRIRSAKIIFLRLRKSNCEKAIAKKQLRKSNCEKAIAKKQLRKSNFRTPESCGRIRSAKIIFLRLRKSNCEKAIFELRRVAGVSGVQKLYFCDCEKAIAKKAIAKKHFSHSGELRAYPECKNYIFAIAKKRLRKSNFRTPEKFRPDPECKNFIFAIAKKHFSHSGEIPAGSGVQKFYFCNCEKAFFALRRNSGRIRSAKILFLQLRKSIFRTPEKFRPDPECKNFIFALAKKHFSHSGELRAYPECKNFIFALAKKHFSHSGELRAYPECKNYIFAIAKKRLRKSNFRTPESCGRIRSAKIIFLRLRKSIFRTPETTPENLFSL